MHAKDTNQRVRPPGQGQAINASDLRKMLALILQCVKGGRGIQVERVGQSIIVSQQAGTRGGGGGGTGGVGTWCKTATTKAGLEEPVSEVYFGRVTSGADEGMMCVRNPDNDGWNAFTHFE